MNDEQFRLIACMLNSICGEVYAIVPYVDNFGIDLGMCRYCLAHGNVEYYEVVLRHKDDCPVTLNTQLQATIKDV